MIGFGLNIGNFLGNTLQKVIRF